MVFEIDGPLQLKAFMDLAFINGYDNLKVDPWFPRASRDIPPDSNLWDLIKRRDILLHHPYEHFEPVVQLIQKAAEDENVIAIKMTLYRTSGKSPIVKALAEAAVRGKQVAVLVELKARFDEQRNITWAKQLEKAGVTVIYGIAHLKVHAKAMLIVRKHQQVAS